jgi:ankyrin repeat protein
MAEVEKGVGTGKGAGAENKKPAETQVDPSRLIQCVRGGSFDEVRGAVARGAQLEMRDKVWNWTPLMFAVRENKEKHNAIAVFLIENGADIYAKDYDGSSVLAKAAFAGNTELVVRIGNMMVLENKGVLVNLADDKGFTPLMNAAMNGKTDTVMALRELHAAMDAASQDGDTAAMLAATWGHAETFAVLKNSGADLKIRNLKGLDALEIARANGFDSSIFGLERK